LEFARALQEIELELHLPPTQIDVREDVVESAAGQVEARDVEQTGDRTRRRPAARPPGAPEALGATPLGAAPGPTPDGELDVEGAADGAAPVADEAEEALTVIAAGVAGSAPVDASALDQERRERNSTRLLVGVGAFLVVTLVVTAVLVGFAASNDSAADENDPDLVAGSCGAMADAVWAGSWVSGDALSAGTMRIELGPEDGTLRMSGVNRDVSVDVVCGNGTGLGGVHSPDGSVVVSGEPLDAAEATLEGTYRVRLPDAALEHGEARLRRYEGAT
jgi:hypothetical protein